MKTTMILILLLVTTGSCYTASRARRQVVHAQATHPDIVAALCGQMYPPRDSVYTATQFITGETKYLPGETKYVNCDSGSNKGNSRVAVPCPPVAYRVDTIKDKSSIYLVNRAKEQAQASEIKELSTLTSELQTEKRLLLYWAIAATLAALIFLILLMKYK